MANSTSRKADDRTKGGSPWECLNEATQGTFILSLEGDLSGKEATLLSDKMAPLLDRNNLRNVVLNLEKVKNVDSEGLSTLLTLHRRFTEKEVGFRLVNVNGNVLHFLQVTNLINLFELGHPTEGPATLIRKQRKALWQSHAFTTQLLSALGEAVLGLDLEGRILFANPAAERVFSWEEADLLGKPLSECARFLHGPGQDWDPAILFGASNGSQKIPVQRVDLTLVNRGGRQADVELVATRIFQSGEEIGLVLGIQDHTKKKRAEEDLKLLATAIQQSADMLVITDINGTIEYVNPIFTAVTGYEPHEAVGRNIRMLKSGRHDSNFYEELWQQISQGHVWTGRITNRRKDGGLYEEESTISPVFDSNGQIKNFVNIKRDVTKEVFQERQLMESQKMEAIAQLTGGIAHDFNNLLTTVMGNLGLAKRRATPEATKFLDNAEKACLRGASLIQQMLLYSRKTQSERTTVDLESIAKEVMTLARETIDRRIELAMDFEEEGCFVTGDPGQIHQTILNLILNARDAIEDCFSRETWLDGEIKRGRRDFKIVVGTRKVRLTDCAQLQSPEASPGAYAILFVKDNGSGMPQETVDHIFEPFFTTKEEGKGTGLGLATVYGIAKSHQGWIEVASAEGEGSIFEVYLPSVETIEPSLERTYEGDGFVEGTETILMVDDEVTICEVAKASFEALGYRVILAHDGLEAIEVFGKYQKQLDLVILDLSLPKLSGGEVLKAIRRKDSEVPVIISSGYDVKHHGDHGLKDYHSVIQKPYRAGQLIGEVRRVLDTVLS
ncbi:MAG: anti-sigma factor antagonist [Candidatus Omnitrophica bacterium]|nr:anti-sigma factor antagonist [Candidatus Omnitrophota bacterium]